MILFLSDWSRFPSAIPDLKTTNESFLRMAHLYKSMGIKNHAFLLALMQPELQGVDPHDPNLTLEQKAKIGLECKYNPWYYFREVVRIPAVAASVPGRFLANRGNIALIWAFLCNIDAANIQPRQTGKSTSTDCLMVWVTYVGGTNNRTTMITKDDALRRSNVDRLKGIRDLLPGYLVSMTREDSDNQFELTCNALGNKYTTGVSQNSEAASEKLGRGLTSPILHCDEGPFISFIGTALPAALAAGTAAREEAAKYNRPNGNIFTTTAGKKDDRDGRFMYDLIHGGAVWDEAFFDAADKRDLRLMVEQNGTGGAALVNITMSHRQLGKTDEWLRRAIAMARATGEGADRDFLNVWTSGTQRSPLSVALNERIHKSEIDHLYTEVSPERYILRWYVSEEELQERMASGNYVIGLDTSDAVGRDAIAMVIIDVRDLSTMAVGLYNETNLIRFAQYVLQLLIKYPTTTLIMERKSSAPTIFDYLMLKLPMAGHDPFRRMFNRIVDEAREREEAYKEVLNRGLMARPESFYDQRKKSFGFMTDKESRNLLYGIVLQNAAKQGGHLVRDRTLSSEIRGLVEKNGRIDHNASGHDDTVIAWLMCHWFLTHGRNLSHYGIDTQAVMVDVGDNGKELTPEDVQERARQTAYMLEIDELLEKLRNNRDEFLTLKYEHRLKYLSGKITDQQIQDTGGMDAMIEQAAEERVKRNRMNIQQQRINQRSSAASRAIDQDRSRFIGSNRYRTADRYNGRQVNINYA